MNLTVDAQALDLRFLATSEGILPVKTEYGTDKQKVDSAGRPLFSGAALQCVRLTNDGRPNGVDSSVSVSVRRAAELQFGHMYELAGSVTVIHYVAHGGVDSV